MKEEFVFGPSEIQRACQQVLFHLGLKAADITEF